MAVAADLSRGEEGGCHSTPTFLCYTQVSMKSGVSGQPYSWKGSVNRRLTKVAMTLSRKIENVRSQVDLSINGWISPRRLSERSSKSLFGQGFTRIRADIVGKQPRNQRNSAQIRVLFFLSDSLLVQCDGSYASLATEWRLMVAQSFKAGVHWIRRLKPAATISRHAVTGIDSKLAEFTSHCTSTVSAKF